MRRACVYTRITQNRGVVKMKESEIEKYLTKGVKELGGRSFKWESPGNNGVPDRIVILKDRNPIFVELKTEKGKLSPVQGIQINRLRSLGQHVWVLYGIKDVQNFLSVCREDDHGI